MTGAAALLSSRARAPKTALRSSAVSSRHWPAGEIAERELANSRANQPQGRVTDGRSHSPHLSIFSLRHSRASHASGTFLRKRIGGSRGGTSGADGVSARDMAAFGNRPIDSSARQTGERSGVRHALDLHPVFAAMSVLGSSNSVLRPGSSLNRSKPSESASSRPSGYTTLGSENSAKVRQREPGSGVNCERTPYGLWRARSRRVTGSKDTSNTNRPKFLPWLGLDLGRCRAAPPRRRK